MFKRFIAGLIIGSMLMAEIPMSVTAAEIVVEDLSVDSTQIERVDSVEEVLTEESAFTVPQSQEMVAEESVVTASQTELLYSGTDVVPNDETDIPDPALYAALKAEMEKFLDRDKSVTAEKLELLTSLKIYNNSVKIESLQGLEYCKNLESLTIRSHAISDVSPLAGLTSLRALNLEGNQIEDVSALSELTSLEELLLGDNLLKNANGLEKMTSLRRLWLNDNQIADISALAGLTGLEDLYLGRNKISDISSLSGLTGLSYLSLLDNQISDISALSGLTQLKGLYLTDNQISDIRALESLTGLYRLDISDNQISDLGPLAGLSYLYTLLADNNGISNLDPLRNLTAMEDLALSHNQIVDVSPLSGMKYLYALWLSHNQIVDPTPLNSINPECRVDLSYNLITDVSGFYLIYVNLEGNPCATPMPTTEPVVTEAPITTNTPAPEPTYTPEPTATPLPTVTPCPTDIVVAEVLVRLDAELSKKMVDRTIYVDLSDLNITTADWESISASVMDQLNNNNIDYFFIYSMQTYKNIYGYVPKVSFAISQEFCVDGFVSWGKIDYQSKQLDYEIKCALSQIREDMSIAEKALVLQNYQILNCRFSSDCSDTDENSGAHASLLKSIGKPYNYADSLKVLLEAAGIEVRCFSACSTSISWVLIQLEDGNWYSLDSMRDEVDLQLGGEIIQHDDGAVRYDNFLQGGDVYWEYSDTWNESTPLAQDGSVFAKYSFDALQTCLNPCGSAWYYLDEESNISYVVKTAFDGSNKERIALDEKAYYLFSYKDKLYYNTEDMVYKFDPVTGAKEVFYNPSMDYPGYVISEFGVKHSSQAYLEWYNEVTGDNQVLSMPFDSVPVDEIFVSASKIRLWEIGETETLSTWYIPSYADSTPNIVWSSMDPAVATVDTNGVVTAVSWGTTTVVAKSADGTLEAVCQVEVKEPGVSSVTFGRDTYYMNSMGAQLELYKDVSIHIAENCQQYVVWESSDSSVVSVDNGGILTAVSYGSAIITVTTSDGVSGSCKVTVDPAAMSVLHLDVDTVYLGNVGVARQLETYTDLEGTTNEDFSWSSSDTSVATISSGGLLTAVGIGECVVTVECAEWNLSASCTVIVESGGDTPDGIVDEQRALVQAFVERMYTVALGRASDSEGVEYWTNQLVAKTNGGATVARGFILSDELTKRGYSDSEYVKVLYKTFFDREADEGGESYWCNALSAGATRGQVLAGFVNSDEFFGLCADFGISRGVLRDDGSAVNPGIYRFAERLYSTILERSGDKEGIEYWTLQIDSQTYSPEDAAIGFFWSGEYLSMNSTNQEYIYALYRMFMDREPDKSGLSYWGARLQSGTDRQTALREFAACEEFKNIKASYGL